MQQIRRAGSQRPLAPSQESEQSDLSLAVLEVFCSTQEFSSPGQSSSFPHCPSRDEGSPPGIVSA